jgi:hypothetical protein
MALFKCKQTGNTVEFDLEHDIDAMRTHPDYEEVIAEVKQEEEKPVKKTVAKLKAE